MGDTLPLHPTKTELDSFVHGQLNEADQQRVEQHLENCHDCCEVLRSIPHDDLVEKLRSSSHSHEPVSSRGKGEIEIPAELADHPRYKIVGQIGAGGMGVVYQAEHRMMERQVALKVINSKLVESDDAIERFQLEVKAAARLSHRNIVTAFDADVAGDSHFLVMEFVEGSSLWDRVKRKGPLSVLHACNYTMQAALGLQHAMDQGMVHRDIKPNNLMRTKKGVVKILDFGLAKFANHQLAVKEDTALTSASATLGTPDFIAPEQARNSRNADIRADIYSLGCTLYFLLAGRAPFPTGTIMEKVVAHFEREPDSLRAIRSDIPAELAAVISKMMAKDPDDRFQTPVEVAEALALFGKPEKEAAPATIGAGNTTQATTQSPEPETRPMETFADDRSAPTSAHEVEAGAAQQPRNDRPSKRMWFIVAGVVLAVLCMLMIAAPVAQRFLFPRTDPLNVSPENDGWIDLLARVEPARHAVQGEWRITPQGLAVNSVANARLVLPYHPPAQYDFEVEFTRNTGSDSIALQFVAGQGQATYEIDAWNDHLAGIQIINGQTLQNNATRVEDMALINGQRYTALVQVRSGEVGVFLNGDRLATYRGDGSDLGVLEMWQTPDSRAIGVGAYTSETIFHSIRVRTVE